ncbi:MAG: winged-helix domain-containing protein [Gemmataceae bacterium]
MPAISLEELNQQIAQRERELDALRQELESRRTQFTTLTRRKEELRRQLEQVEAEIAALSAAQQASTEQPKKAPPPAPPRQPSVAGQLKLGDMILDLLREADKPMTARELNELVHQRGFQMTGRNPVKSVEARVQELKKKGLVRRAAGHPGYSLASSAQDAKAEKPKTVQPAQKEDRKAAEKPAKAEPTATTPQTGQRGKQPPLRQVLTNVLKNSRKPLSGSDLAERVLATGYKTNSKNFVDAVWSMLGQMDNIEHTPGKGYQLKKMS